jgi:hypothetical protein
MLSPVDQFQKPFRNDYPRPKLKSRGVHLALPGSMHAKFQHRNTFSASNGRLYNHGCFGQSTQRSVLEKWLIALSLKLSLPTL